ncbi:hypothetical protein DL771_004597 [Monosporascus sp. 5C6A]|nr:hypothetical protein DL771_004597 [Monosporascus sp. 5C6A]
MAPVNIRTRGEPSSFQQQPTPAFKETIEVQGESEEEEEYEEEEPETEKPELKGKEKERTTDEKLDLLAKKLQALKKENARFARKEKESVRLAREEKEKASVPPVFAPDPYREITIPLSGYHGMPEVKGYKPAAFKPYDGFTDVEGFLI